MKYITKPEEIEAIQWNGKNEVNVYNFLENANAKSSMEISPNGQNFYIAMNNGSLQTGDLMVISRFGYEEVNIGDYIIKSSINGHEFFTVEVKHIFEKNYVQANLESKEESTENPSATILNIKKLISSLRSQAVKYKKDSNKWEKIAGCYEEKLESHAHCYDCKYEADCDHANNSGCSTGEFELDKEYILADIY